MKSSHLVATWIVFLILLSIPSSLHGQIKETTVSSILPTILPTQTNNTQNILVNTTLNNNVTATAFEKPVKSMAHLDNDIPSNPIVHVATDEIPNATKVILPFTSLSKAVSLHGKPCPDCPPGGICCEKLLCCPDPNWRGGHHGKDEAKRVGDQSILSTEEVLSKDSQTAKSIVSIIIHSSLPLIFLVLLSVIICLSWSVCPLYDFAHLNKKYTKDEAGCADTFGQLPVYMRVMPSEEVPLGNILVLNTSLLEDEDERGMSRDEDALL